MEERRKIDFKKHTSSPVSKWYMARIVFYVILLSALLFILFNQKDQPAEPDVHEVQQIDNVTIET